MVAAPVCSTSSWIGHACMATGYRVHLYQCEGVGATVGPWLMIGCFVTWTTTVQQRLSGRVGVHSIGR